MRIVLYNQYYLFEDVSLEFLDRAIDKVLSGKITLPDWIVVALIDEKLARNEWHYNDN
jgi:hypothetical protein